MTLFVQDVKSGENAIDVVEEFENISGVHLNRNKAKAMWLVKICPVGTQLRINVFPCVTLLLNPIGIYFFVKITCEFDEFCISQNLYFDKCSFHAKFIKHNINILICTIMKNNKINILTQSVFDAHKGLQRLKVS